MRVVRVDESESDHHWVWLAAGVALGVVGALVVSRKLKGRRPLGSLGSLVRRGRALAESAADSIGPIVEAAQSIRDAWQDRAAEPRPDEDDEDAEDGLAQELDVEEEGFVDGAGYAEFDDDEDDDVEDESDALDARVLEAFANDPILAERSIEIEERDGAVIVLHGRVRSDREVKHAVTIARGVPGVGRVRDRLTVRKVSR